MKIIEWSDGTKEYEGTPEELAEFERQQKNEFTQVGPQQTQPNGAFWQIPTGPSEPYMNPFIWTTVTASDIKAV
jgi:hypothetical protein